MAGEADVDVLSRLECTALEGDWEAIRTERARLLHALADVISADRVELAELQARNVDPADLPGQAELHSRESRIFWYDASAIATIGGPREPIRWLSPLRSAEGARRRRRASRLLDYRSTTRMEVAASLEALCSVGLMLIRRRRRRRICMAALRPMLVLAGAVTSCPGYGPTTAPYLVRYLGVDKVAFIGRSIRRRDHAPRVRTGEVNRRWSSAGSSQTPRSSADADLAERGPSSARAIYDAAGQSC